MNRKIKFSLSIAVCFLGAVFLSNAAQVLDRVSHPLVSSLTCVETEDPSDLYWNINQIELRGGINQEDHSVWMCLSNNIPNFESYYFRVDGNEQWQQSKDGRINLEAGEGVHTLELRASNALGGELPSRVWAVNVGDRAVTIMPDEEKIKNGRYRFRFEKPGSKKIEWLREHTLPVIARSPHQWNSLIALRSWVSRQIPNKIPVMKSRWDAQRILQAVRKDPSVGFICDAYAATYVSCCASVGLIARMIHLGDESNNGHYAAEVWSDAHKKWIFMDPLYDCHFTLQDAPLSALELHNLWKRGKIREVITHGRDGMILKAASPPSGYANLFQDIQLVNANDFLTTPFSSVLDLLTSKIRFLRYIDESNPPYNRVKQVWQLLMFYYLPILISGFIIPFVIPGYLILITMRLGKHKK